jgi:hypothetical protein
MYFKCLAYDCTAIDYTSNNFLISLHIHQLSHNIMNRLLKDIDSIYKPQVSNQIKLKTELIFRYMCVTSSIRLFYFSNIVFRKIDLISFNFFIYTLSYNTCVINNIAPTMTAAVTVIGSTFFNTMPS